MYIKRMLEGERVGKRNMNNFGAGGKGWNHKHKTAFIILFSSSSPLLHPLPHSSFYTFTYHLHSFLSNFSMRYKSIGGEKRKKIGKNVFYYHYFSLKESYAKRWYEITSLVRIRSSSLDSLSLSYATKFHSQSWFTNLRRIDSRNRKSNEKFFSIKSNLHNSLTEILCLEAVFSILYLGRTLFGRWTWDLELM